jgi:hypothetical protein
MFWKTLLGIGIGICLVVGGLFAFMPHPVTGYYLQQGSLSDSGSFAVPVYCIKADVPWEFDFTVFCSVEAQETVNQYQHLEGISHPQQ